MLNNVGPFAGHTFEAYMHMVLEKGREGMTDASFLSPDAPDALNMWKKRATWSQIRPFRGRSELDGQLMKAPNSYWKAAEHNFAAIDGLRLSGDTEPACIHFLQITTNKNGKDGKVGNRYLQDYARRLMEGWPGGRGNIFACLWFALPAALRDDRSGPYSREQNLDMTPKRKKRKGAPIIQPEEKEPDIPILQGKVKFDFRATLEGAPVNEMAEAWWRQHQERFSGLLAEYEAFRLAPAPSRVKRND